MTPSIGHQQVARTNLIDRWGLISLEEFIQRVDADRPTYAGQEKEAQEWLNIIKRHYMSSGLNKPIKFLGNDKYMGTRKAGIIDLEHYLNMATRSISETRGKTNYKDIIKDILIAEDKKERDDDRFGSGVNIEDSPSNFRGAILGMAIMKRGCKTYDEVADLVIKHLQSFGALEEKAQEDAFLEKAGYSTMGLYLRNNGESGFTILDPISGEPTSKYKDINPIIGEALHENM